MKRCEWPDAILSVLGDDRYHPVFQKHFCDVMWQGPDPLFGPRIEPCHAEEWSTYGGLPGTRAIAIYEMISESPPPL